MSNDPPPAEDPDVGAALAVPEYDVRISAAVNSLDAVLRQGPPRAFEVGARVWVDGLGEATVIVVRPDVRDSTDRPAYAVRWLDGSVDFVREAQIDDWSPGGDQQFCEGDIVWDTDFGLRATVLSVTDVYHRSERLYVVAYDNDLRRDPRAARYDGPEPKPGSTGRTLHSFLRPWTPELDESYRRAFAEAMDRMDLALCE